jgi:hypothetical protein
MKAQKRIVIISSILALVCVNCILTSAFPKLNKTIPTNTVIPTAVVIPEITIQPTIVVMPDSVAVTFTEADVQGWIEEFSKSNSDLSIQNPKVSLDNGICTITGQFQSGFIKGDVVLTFTVTLDASATPVVTVQSLQLGGMDLPESVKKSFSDTINLNISSSLTSGLEGRTIQSITIDDGLITIQTSN